MITTLRRHASLAALAIASLALVVSTTGLADAAKKRTKAKVTMKVSTKPRAGYAIALNRRRQLPASVVPKVRAARAADTFGGQTPEQATPSCAPTTVDLGSWCLQANPFPVPPEDNGKNDFFYATQSCVEAGGYLPTAAQLVGAADRVKLASVIDDNQLTASIDVDPTDGLKDRREMSSTLATTQAGSSAAGSIGVSDGSRGDPKTGEPNPVPQPAVPRPESLQYVTVYDNRDRGGFGGSKPVSSAENFRCAFNKTPGAALEGEDGAATDSGQAGGSGSESGTGSGSGSGSSEGTGASGGGGTSIGRR